MIISNFGWLKFNFTMDFAITEVFGKYFYYKYAGYWEICDLPYIIYVEYEKLHCSNIGRSALLSMWFYYEWSTKCWVFWKGTW